MISCTRFILIILRAVFNLMAVDEAIRFRVDVQIFRVRVRSRYNLQVRTKSEILWPSLQTHSAFILVNQHANVNSCQQEFNLREISNGLVMHYKEKFT